MSMGSLSLCTDPSSKGGKGLCNYEPKLAKLSRNLFWWPRNESLNSTDSFFPSGIIFYGFCILVFEFFLQSVFPVSNDCFKDRGQINKDKCIF